MCSLCLGILLTEGALRVWFPQPMNGSVFTYAPRGYLVNKSAGSARFTIGPHSGVYRFAAPHLRHLGPSPPGARRILVLGDSFTFGIGLADEETYVGRLQRVLDSTFAPERVALLNAGIPGSGTAEHLAFLEDFGEAIGPRMVLLIVSVDDFERAARSPLYRLRNAETLQLDAGAAPMSPIKRLVSGSATYSQLVERSHLVQLARRAVLATGSTASPDTAGQRAVDRRLVRALVRRMKAWCDRHDARLAVINNGWRSYDWLPDLLRAEGIPFHDAAPLVQPALAADEASLTIPADGHPSAKGAAVIARAIWPFLVEFIREAGAAQSSGAGRPRT